MPELVSPVQQRQTIMKIRPYRRGWQCFEAPGVEPFWTGENAKQSAIDYAKGSNQPMSCRQADFA